MQTGAGLEGSDKHLIPQRGCADGSKEETKGAISLHFVVASVWRKTGRTARPSTFHC